MTTINAIWLAGFVLTLAKTASFESVILNIFLINVFAHIWICLIWSDSGKHILASYLWFVLIVGPLSYIGYSATREYLISIGYPAFRVHVFQPLSANAIPFISLLTRLRETTPPLNTQRFIFRAVCEVCLALPAWMALLAFLP